VEGARGDREKGKSGKGCEGEEHTEKENQTCGELRVGREKDAEEGQVSIEQREWEEERWGDRSNDRGGDDKLWDEKSGVLKKISAREEEQRGWRQCQDKNRETNGKSEGPSARREKEKGAGNEKREEGKWEWEEQMGRWCRPDNSHEEKRDNVSQ
jgi:hypothetical protein